MIVLNRVINMGMITLIFIGILIISLVFTVLYSISCKKEVEKYLIEIENYKQTINDLRYVKPHEDQPSTKFYRKDSTEQFHKRMKALRDLDYPKDPWGDGR